MDNVLLTDTKEHDIEQALMLLQNNLKSIRLCVALEKVQKIPPYTLLCTLMLPNTICPSGPLFTFHIKNI